MTEAQKTIEHAKSEASGPKRELIRLWNELDQRKGCSVSARRLAKVIRLLESWQNSR